MPHQIPADATPVLTRTKQTIGWVAPVHIPASEDPWTGEQLPATVRYAAWLADGTPAGGWDSYRYTVLTYGHDRYDTAAKAKNAVRRIHQRRAEYAAYARNHHTEVL